MKRIIWQYWETRGEKPAFVEGLHRLACRNSGCEVIQVTPDNLKQYLPDIPGDIFNIQVLAHKADMIRAMLVSRYGGMWLDSDAIVLRDVGWLFDYLREYEFIGFNDRAALEESRPWVNVNCFLSRPNGRIIREWVRQQHAKFPRVDYVWDEIGTALLHPICLANRELVKMLPFEQISPIYWDRVRDFMRAGSAERIIAQCYIVMLRA